MNLESNKLFMAFSAGKSSVESEKTFDKYIGIAPVTILAVNPTLVELMKLYNNENIKEPVYTNTVEINGEKVPTARITFIVKTEKVVKNNNVIHEGGIINSMSFSIYRMPRYNKDKTKMQVIDKYGRTAWATIEEINNKLVPTYSTGNKAAIDPNYRPLYAGEEELVKFLINYLGIPATFKKTSEGLYITKSPEELKECEASLEKIEQYFKGDISEIKNIIKIQPENKVKVMFGVRSVDDKQYQAIYTRETLKSGATNYDKIAKSLKDAKDNGAFADTEFEACDIKKYVVNATTFEDNSNPSDDPFAGF